MDLDILDLFLHPIGLELNYFNDLNFSLQCYNESTCHHGQTEIHGLWLMGLGISLIFTHICRTSMTFVIIWTNLKCTQ